MVSTMVKDQWRQASRLANKTEQWTAFFWTASFFGHDTAYKKQGGKKPQILVEDSALASKAGSLDELRKLFQVNV